MFPDNEFWNCPSYTWSSISLGFMVAMIVSLVYAINTTLGEVASYLSSIIMLGWMIYNIYRWVNPNARCERPEFPGQHYANPFYKKPVVAEPVSITPPQYQT
jgi:hypothetical protein